jgi:hypothetical protein
MAGEAVNGNEHGGRSANAAKLIGAGAAAAGALAVLTSIHAGLVDAAADAVLIASLLSLAHAVFRLVDEPGEIPPGGDEDRDGAQRDGPRGAKR